MRRSARVTWALLLFGVGMTVFGVSGAAKPMRGIEQQKTPEPQQDANKENSPAIPAPRPNPDTEGIYHVGDGVSAPQITYSIDPEFYRQSSQKEDQRNVHHRTGRGE
jgi:hypothetical protein